jgi:hypothetical protein
MWHHPDCYQSNGGPKDPEVPPDTCDCVVHLMFEHSTADPDHPLRSLTNRLVHALLDERRKSEEALEAIRFTQEYAQLPAIDGWSWWDVYRKYRPEDAVRLHHEWMLFDSLRGTIEAEEQEGGTS